MAIYGREVGFSNSAPNDEAYTWYKTITATTTFTVTESAWYRFYVIGNGGNGGNGSEATTTYSGPGGSGGGSGGYSVHEVRLTKDDVATITIDSTKTQVQIGEDIIYANHGNKGKWGTAAGSAGGSGGEANGGNLINYSGLDGEAGAPNRYSGSQYMGGAGASGKGPDGQILKYKYVDGAPQVEVNKNNNNGYSGTGTITGSDTLLGMAASGGLGGNMYSCQDSTTYCGGHTGGTGFTGGVVIDKAS